MIQRRRTTNRPMSYRIGKYHFATKEEYEAGLRDYYKLSHLKQWKQGASQEEIARNFRAQIAALGIQFESKIGEEFLQMTELSASGKYRISSFAEEEKRLNQLRHQLMLRQGILLPLYAFLGGAVMVLLLYVFMNLRSVHDLKRMQESIAQSGPSQENLTASAENSAASIPLDRVLPQMLPAIANLHEKNPDFVGWLKIPGTEIDYPVMWREGDNDYYLTHNFIGEYDRNGLLILDKQCEANGEGANNLIHGHNMKSGAMFGALMDYTEEDFFLEHPRIFYTGLYEAREYEIMAVFRSSVYDPESGDFAYYDYISLEDAADFDEYVESVKKEAFYDTGVTAEWGDHLLTLSTCEYSRDNGRLVIVAREVREGS